ncbi:hypothetical protein EON79_04610 [bacterium]|nr:MAG: hypothetical protein EON79_04610 [bacterium]
MSVFLASLVIAAQAQTPAVAPPGVAALTGPKVGDTLQPFSALHVYGPLGNRTRDFVTLYPSDPKVVAWVSEGQTQLTQDLAKELQAQVKANADSRLRALIVVLTKDKLTAEPRVRQIGYRIEANDVSMAVMEPTETGLIRHNISPETKLAIVVARGGTISANVAAPDANKVPTDALRAAISEAVQPASKTTLGQ